MPLFNPVQIAPQQPWINATLISSWVYAGAPYNFPGYWRDQFGVVHLRGALSQGATGATIFSLPVGYRPANREMFPVISYTSNAVLGRVDVYQDGRVIHVLGGNVIFMLDGITFRAV